MEEDIEEGIEDVDEGIEDMEEGNEDIEEGIEEYKVDYEDYDEDSLIITFSGSRPDFADSEISGLEENVDTETMETEESDTVKEEAKNVSTGSESIRKYFPFLSSYPVFHRPRPYYTLPYHTHTYQTYPNTPPYLYSYFG